MPNPRVLDPKKPLTPRERKYVKNRAKGKGVGKSALDAGYATKEYGSFLNSQEKIQTAIQKAMDVVGLTDEFLLERVKEGCEATIPARKSKDGVVLVEEHPDHFNRPRYLDMSFKMKKHYLPEGAHEEKNITLIQINMTDTRLKGLLDSGMISRKEFKELKEQKQEVIKAEIVEENESKGT